MEEVIRLAATTSQGFLGLTLNQEFWARHDNRVPSLLRLDNWDTVLDPTNPEDQELRHGLRYGFGLAFDNDFTPITTFMNHQSARAHEAEILKDYERLRTQAPYDQFPRLIRFTAYPPGLSIAPLGCRRKKNGSMRPFLDLSFPKQKSINLALGVPPTFTMMRLRVFLDRIQQNDYLFRFDLRDAYLGVPLAPSAWHATGVRVGGEYFLYMYCPFGLAWSSVTFNRVAATVCRIFNAVGHTLFLDCLSAIRFLLDHYADDYLGRENDLSRAELAITAFGRLLDFLGLLWEESGIVRPARQITALGFHLDSERMQIAIPADKVSTIRAAIRAWIGRGTTTRAELNSFGGLLNWVATVAQAGRIFTRSTYRLLRDTRALAAGATIEVAADVRQDMSVWDGILADRAWQPFSTFIRGHVENVHLTISTDASNAGFGAFWHGRWIIGTFDEPDLRGAHINVQEMYIVTVAALRWGHLFHGQYVTFLIDNRTITFGINNHRSANDRIFLLIKAAVTHAIRHNFDFGARHVRGIDNEICDALSRGDMPRFWAAATAWANEAPDRVLQPRSD